MGMRFRRRIRLAPGVHLNLSGSGVSLSAGPRGASVTLGKNGLYRNLGIPGTGLYSREKIGVDTSRRTRATAPPTEKVEMPVTVTITDTGEVLFKDRDGKPVDDWIVRETRKQRGNDIRKLMQDQAGETNQAITKATDIHLATPPIDQGLPIEPAPFTTAKPRQPKAEPVGMFTKLFQRKRRLVIEQKNREHVAAYVKALKAWEKLKALHDAAEEKRVATLRSALQNDMEVMERYLAQRLEEMEWPQDTFVSFEFENEGKVVVMDVDLPEIEDLPDKTARVPQRGWKVTVKALSDKQKRLNYSRHVHGILFRLIGETYSLFPSVEQVVISGYSQRPSPKTGQIEDDYLLSAKVTREGWARINFDNLKAVDPVEALSNFELCRNMTKTGIFKPIEPLSLALL